MSTRLRAAIAAVLLLFLVGLGSAAWLLRWSLGAPDAAAGTTPPVHFEVRSGATLQAVARELEAQGLVRHRLAFEGLARWRGLGAELRAGEYALGRNLDAQQVLETIAAGRVRTHPLSLPEGLTAVEIAARIETAGLAEAQEFLAAVRDPGLATALGVEGDSLEGYLFPETYRIARGLSARAVASTLVREFQKNWAEVAAAAEQRGMSMREVVTLASIVEKETAVAAERPLIAGVFHNRLRRGMRLETDPTVIYGIPDFDGNLTRAHLEDASNPYNTYRIHGLPPGPIANPGALALRAAVEPTPTDYLFFVSRNDGSHVFSRSYREHAAAVDRYQRRGRRNRSP